MTKKINQQGIVSIVTTLIIIIIITVVTLSLSAISRRELRQALDEQLSSQALYAAETGVNDAIKKIKSNDSAVTTGVDSCSKTGTGVGAIFTNNTLGENIKYTCVLIDKTPGSIVTDIPIGGMKVYTIDTAADNMSTLKITWSGKNGESDGSCTVDGTCFSTAGGWGDKMGLLRVRLLDNRYIPNTEVVAYPGPLSSDASNTANTAALGDKKVLYGSCSTDKSCFINITGLFGARIFKLQLYSYYGDIKVDVEGYDSSGGNVSFLGAQTTIDSTGAAADVLRRIKVAIPSDNNIESFPNFVLSSGTSLCKRFTTNATETKDFSDATTCPALP